MGLWIKIIAVNENGKERFLGDQWNSSHKCYTAADPEDEEWMLLIDLDKIPKNTKKIKIEGIP